MIMGLHGSRYSHMFQGGRMAAKHNKLIQRQKIMDRVLIALIPCAAGAVYYFGWYCLFIILLANAAGFVTEYLFARKQGKPVSQAVFVTGTLFALVMPPSVPWYVAVIGMVFAVMFGKMVFGGFGKNVFNPAISGRAFVYVCFPLALTAAWPPPARGPFGALDRWSTASAVDTVSGASVLAYLKTGQMSLDTETGSGSLPYGLDRNEQKTVRPSALLKGLLFGRISGTMGVTGVILICIGGIYLFVTKAANRTLILSVIITYAFWSELLFRLGVAPVPGAWPAVLGGGFLFGAFFMVTDPVSAPNTGPAKIMYGILIGTSTMIIKNFSIFNGGLMFSILIGNMFAPTFDTVVNLYRSRKK